MFTDSYRTSQENSFLVKFSDDSVVLSLLQGSESDVGPVLPEYVKWCDDYYFYLNLS